MPSRFSTPSPPSWPSLIAVSGEMTPSIAEPSSGSSRRCGPSFHPMSTSCGSRVRRLGTIAMSSKPYACLAFLPLPISISTGLTPLSRKADDANSELGRDRLEFLDLDALGDARELAGLEPSRSDLLDGRCSRRHGEA